MVSKTLRFVFGKLVVAALVAAVGAGLVVAAGTQSASANDGHDGSDVKFVSGNADGCHLFDWWNDWWDDDGHDRRHDDHDGHDHDDWDDDGHDGHDHDDWDDDHDGHDHDHDGHDHDWDDDDDDVRVIFLGECAPVAPAVAPYFIIINNNIGGVPCAPQPVQTVAQGFIVITNGCGGPVAPFVAPFAPPPPPPAPSCPPGSYVMYGGVLVRCQ